MSSPEYLSRLRPDPALRRFVLAGGLMLVAGGCTALAVLPLPAGSRALLAMAWLAAGGSEVLAMAVGFRRMKDICIGIGGVAVIRDRAGEALRAELLPGSVVTAGFAWLRYRSADGSRHAEPFSGNGRASEDWRRFQVIWRHIGASR